MNWIQFINRNVTSVVLFFSGTVKLTLGLLDRVDMMVRQHLTKQGMLMKRGMATSRLYMKPEDMGLGLKVVPLYTSRSWSDSSSNTKGEPSSVRTGFG